MNPGLDIDGIVAEVLRRLAQLPGASSVPAAPVVVQSPAKTRPTADDVLVIEQRVVSTAQLERRLEGIRRVQVRPGAIVTPAARDLLRDKQIVVETAASEGKQNSASQTPLVVVQADCQFDSTTLLSKLTAGGIATQQLARTGLASGIEELSGEVVRGGRLGLLFTTQTLPAVCLANRQCGVRAAKASQVKCVEQARAAIGVNFLIVNPLGKSARELERMLVAFCASGASCPEVLK